MVWDLSALDHNTFKSCTLGRFPGIRRDHGGVRELFIIGVEAGREGGLYQKSAYAKMLIVLLLVMKGCGIPSNS